MEYLTYLVLLVSVLVACWQYRVEQHLSVAFILFCYSILSLTSYILFPLIDVDKEWWYSNYHTDTRVLLVILAIFCGHTLLAWNSLNYKRLFSGRSGEESWELLNNALAPRKRALLNTLQWFSIISATLALVHFVDADFTNAWAYGVYMDSRSADFLCAENVLSVVFFSLKKIIGVVALLSAFLLLREKRILPATGCLVACIYVFLLHLIELSKYNSVFLIMFGVLFSRSKNGTNVKILCSFATLAFVYFFLAMGARVEGQYGISGVLSPSWVTYETIRFVLMKTMYLFFGGYILLANANETSIQFSETHQLYAISPLVSKIDGYDSYYRPKAVAVQYWDSGENLIWAPPSALFELSRFAFVIALAAILVIYFTLKLSTRAFWRFNYYTYLLYTGPLLLAFPMLHFYPLRNEFRYFLLSLALLVFVLFKFRLRSHR